jgi:TPR repeat protein
VRSVVWRQRAGPGRLRALGASREVVLRQAGGGHGRFLRPGLHCTPDRAILEAFVQRRTAGDLASGRSRSLLAIAKLESVTALQNKSRNSSGSLYGAVSAPETGSPALIPKVDEEGPMKLPLFTRMAVMVLLGAKAASGQAGNGAHSGTLAAAPFQPAGDFVAVQKDLRQISPLALAELRRSAESGDRISQNNLAYLYTFGQGLPRDDQEAAKWYTASAAQGLAAAPYNLGALYEHGRGVSKDYQKASIYYRRAAEQGHALAQARMGLMYEREWGVNRNLKEAMRWYRAAAEQGDPSAQCNLGNGFYSGQGVARDYLKAAEWYRQAAERGMPAAQNNLGALYRYGLGVQTDYSQARYWYGKAAEQSFPAAEANLGVMYEDGLGVEKDLQQAVAWYRAAAGHGDSRGQYNLANLYMSGQGVSLDYVSAYYWYAEAASEGESLARQQLKQLERLMTPRQLREARTRISAQQSQKAAFAAAPASAGETADGETTVPR